SAATIRSMCTPADAELTQRAPIEACASARKSYLLIRDSSSFLPGVHHARTPDMAGGNAMAGLVVGLEVAVDVIIFSALADRRTRAEFFSDSDLSEQRFILS